MQRIITLTGKELKIFNKFTSDKTNPTYTNIKIKINNKGTYVLSTNEKQLLIKQNSNITFLEPYQIFIPSKSIKHLKLKSNDIIKINFNNETLSINDNFYYQFKELLIKTHNEQYLDDDILSNIINSNNIKLTSIKAKELKPIINNITKLNKQKNHKHSIPYFILDNNKIYTSLYENNYLIYYIYDSTTKDFYQSIKIPNPDIKLNAKNIKYFLHLIPENSIINIYTDIDKETVMLESKLNSISYKFISINHL